ncbi:maltase 1-like [Onthophagus taurus]|uniref:maltase 1-like n=1 Tax=Onthophagus taurus TaxID=166361 RepID=UPI0039BE6E52
MTWPSTPIFLLLIGVCGVFGQQSVVSEWWQHAVIYQIYPRTFKDSDGDGNGDLQGIISKLDHMQEMGVDAVWLSPIYPSPQVDGGYDISDYRGIDPIYGTMEDFEELVAKANEKGMRIVMDLVPNHSSDQHEWFQKSVKKEGKYADYYVWRDGRGEDGMEPPTNWNSVFAGPAWTYHPERGQFYLHQFAKEQPDLNFENADVVQEMKDIISFWLEKGISGFRVDAIRHLFEEYKDEPLSNNGDPPNSHGYYEHIYSADQDGTYDMVYQWRKLCDDFTAVNGGEPRILMTEAYTNVKEVMRYYGENDALDGAQFPFNFDLIGLNVETDARDIVLLVHTWFAYMPVGATPNWVLGNHDQHRISTRIGSRLKANMMNMLTSVLPGVMVTYNGEEIGMENGEVTFEQGKDPSGLAAGPEGFDAISRDFERTPYHWDDSDNAGFTESGVEPWLPVSKKYKETNLAKEKVTKASVYQNYKALLELRNTSRALREGTWEIYSINKDGLLVIRKYPGEKSVVFVCHLGVTTKPFEIDLLAYGFQPTNQVFDVIATSVEDKFSSTLELNNSKITVNPNEDYVLLERI